MRDYEWFEPGAEKFAEMLDNANEQRRVQMKQAFADALDDVMDFPRSGGTPLIIKGEKLNKKLKRDFVLLSRYDEDRDMVELVGFYHQSSSYQGALEAIL